MRHAQASNRIIAPGFGDDPVAQGALRAVAKGDILLRCRETGALSRTTVRGEYFVTRAGKNALVLLCRTHGTTYTLSFDAAAQHIFEGRLTLSGALPERRSQ